MYATIIPPSLPRGSSAPSALTQGTRVEVAPGIILQGVTKIELRATVDDLWRATIECYVRIQPMKARVQIKLPRPARFYRRGGRAVGRK